MDTFPTAMHWNWCCRNWKSLFLTMDPTEGFLSMGFNFLLAQVHRLLLVAYSRENEWQADEMGIQITAQTCFDTSVGCHMLHKMHDWSVLAAPDVSSMPQTEATLRKASMHGRRCASWSHPGLIPIHSHWNAGNGCKCSVKWKIIPSMRMRNVPVPCIASLVRWGACGGNQVIIPTTTTISTTSPWRRNEFFSPTTPTHLTRTKNLKSLTNKVNSLHQTGLSWHLSPFFGGYYYLYFI